MAEQENTPSRTREFVPYLLVALAFLFICALWDRLLLPGDRDLWDARVYARAIADWRTGSDPYSLTAGGLPFVYPPIFLRLAAMLAQIVSGRLAWLPYLALLIASTLAIPWMLAVDYLRSRWVTPLVALLLFSFQPKLFAEMVFLSGNLGSILYALILAAGVPGVRRNRWLWFYPAVAFAALIKPPFLCFLLLPLLAGRRQFWQSVITTCITLAAYASQWLTMPALFHAFQSAVAVQIVVRQDAGFGLLSYFLKVDQRFPVFHHLAAPFACVFVLSALAATLIFLRLRSTRHAVAATNRLWLPLLLVVAVLANPRMQAYDAEIAILPAIFLCIECVALIPASRFRTPAIAATAAMLIAIVSKNTDAGVFLFLLGSVLLTLQTIARAQTHLAQETVFVPASLVQQEPIDAPVLV